MRVNDYVGKDVIIYSGTPTFPMGTVARVVEFDAVSSPNTVSLLVMDLREMQQSANIDVFSDGWTSTPKWVDLSNIKCVVNYNKPTGILFNFKQKVFAWWMRVSKRKSSMPSDG